VCREIRLSFSRTCLIHTKRLIFRDINELDLDEIIAFHSNRKPIQAKRMDWRAFPILKQRRAMPPPFNPLPPLNDTIATITRQGTEEAPKGYINLVMRY
jgi:hypothetical protein